MVKQPRPLSPPGVSGSSQRDRRSLGQWPPSGAGAWNQSSVISEILLSTCSRDAQRMRVPGPRATAAAAQDARSAQGSFAHRAPAASAVWVCPHGAPSPSPTPLPTGTRCDRGPNEGNPRPQCLPTPRAPAWGGGDAGSIHSELWTAPPCGDSLDGWAQGLEGGTLGAGVAVGQRASCLDVVRHLLVLLRPRLLSPAC